MDTKEQDYQDRDHIIRLVAKQPGESLEWWGGRKNGLDSVRWRNAVHYLKGNNFLRIEGSHKHAFLEAKGLDAMEAGGYGVYMQQQEDQRTLDNKSKEAAISGTVWSRNHGRINIALTTIAIVISVIGMYQASMAGKDRIKSDRAVAHADSTLQVTKAERDSIRMQLIEVRALVDSLRPVPPVLVSPVPTKKR